MLYSVEELSKLYKVSVRTLHYYDEIGLLKPQVRMESGRRLYGIQEIVTLVDILFFKELGFNLKKIKIFLQSKNLDKKAIFSAKKQFLKNEIKRLKNLIDVIDEMQFYFEQDNLDQAQLLKQFDKFQKNTKKGSEFFESQFKEKNDEINKMSLEEQQEAAKGLFENVDMKKYQERMNSCIKKIVEAINTNIKEDSKTAQNLMKEYYQILSMVTPMTKKKWMDSYLNIRQDMDNYYIWAKIHPKLPEFLYNAMMIYKNEIKK